MKKIEKLSDLIPDENNYNKGTEFGGRLIEKSFRKLGAGRSVLADKNGKLIAGNKAHEGVMNAGFSDDDIIVVKTDGTKLVVVQRTDLDLNTKRGKEMALADNATAKANIEWDMEALAADEWDKDELAAWGVSDWSEDPEHEGDNTKGTAAGSLQEKFIVPPFSILDTRQGYWQERKRNWKVLIGDNGESRENKLFTSPPTNPVSKKLQESGGVSILDPVLSECVCYWFGVPGGTAFDCFAGDSVFGYVAAHTGQTFTGIELRQEQADLNAARVEGMTARYICDDAQNVAKHIPPESQDLFFSCPPYFDLEVYSDLPNDASNQGDYQAFLQILKNAFTGAIQCLKNNRFAVVVVGDVRDKKGVYRCFPDDVKKMFRDNGVLFYNDIILIENIGTGALRAGPQMGNRKVVKCHQNVLVFYKGDPREIKKIYPKIEIPETDGSENVEL